MRASIRTIAAVAVLSITCMGAHASKPTNPNQPNAGVSSAAAAVAAASVPTGAQVDKLVETYKQCKHLAGEFGGDNSKRDREVTQQLLALHCEDVTGALERAIKGMPANSPKVKEIARLLKD